MSKRKGKSDRRMARQVDQLTRTVRELQEEVRKTRDWEDALDAMLCVRLAPARPTLRVVRAPGGEVR